MISKKRLTWIDALNIVACAGVLLLHSTNGQIHHFSGTPSYEWFVGLFTHSFFLWPVNVFFMISGFTLIRPFLSVNNSEMGGKTILFTKDQTIRHSTVDMEYIIHAKILGVHPHKRRSYGNMAQHR